MSNSIFFYCLYFVTDCFEILLVKIVIRLAFILLR